VSKSNLSLYWKLRLLVGKRRLGLLGRPERAQAISNSRIEDVHESKQTEELSILIHAIHWGVVR
jgi:hypothetical protein